MRRNIFFVLLIFMTMLILSGCQNTNTDIYFKEPMVLEYGTKDNTLNLIERIGNTKIKDSMIKGTQLICNQVVVECTKVDTSVLTDYEVTYKTNDTENRLITKTIQIKDTTAPKIELKGLDKDKSLLLSMAEFKDYNFSKNISVKDNYDPKPVTNVRVKDIKPNQEYEVLITSVDKFDNHSEETFVVKIKNIEIKSNTQDNQKNKTKQTNKKQDNSSKKSNPTKKSNTDTKNKYSKKNQMFLFGEKYELNGKMVECNMSNVSSICTSRLSGHSGECTPLKNAEGIYIGMKLKFY